MARDNDAWPSVLVLSAVLVPAVCVLWFMGAAMRNERYAARERLADAYRAQLAGSQATIARHWAAAVADLEQIVKTNSPAASFSSAVRAGLVDSFIVFDEKGQILYPNSPLVGPTEAQLEAQWAEAHQLEYARKDFDAAAKRYRALSIQLTNVNLRARALQAAARCLVQGGQGDLGVQLINDELGREAYDHATDAQGRLIVANAELMALELVEDKAGHAFASVARRLEQRLNDYDDCALAASQRRFLMGQVQKLSDGKIEFPTLSAERLAAEVAGRVQPHDETSLRRSPLPDVWQLSIADRRALALIKTETLVNFLQRVADPNALPKGTEIALLMPGADHARAFVSMSVAPSLPGWKLVLSLGDSRAFDAAAKHRTETYLWTGILVVVTMGLLSLLATRVLRRRMALARLKNDLAATVSHELKTPLASMRVLIDTLLDSDRLHEQTTREYLQLVATENERLSRLIENFLTFARLEQGKQTFNFSRSSANQIVDAAVDAVRERLSAPGCRFEVQVALDLPNVLADPDALSIALINLLDNAWKYSGDIKHIVLRASARNGQVEFAVQDNGIGIAPRETRRIFQSFYQVDRRLSRGGGGCGLGLSIVQSIVSAHDGHVSVDSEPGHGSTFTISLSAAARSAAVTREAIA
jgi:signal transduction histidine kinase